MTCAVCARPARVDVHPECMPAGLLQEALLAAAELIAVVAAPTIIVMAG